MDKTRLIAVCIDDFALKKRQRYGTIMVDLDTHRVVDLLPSREAEHVADWLKGFPNLRVVSRDGSTTYANAISMAHPHAYQVSDKFHLIKNLTERATLYFQQIFHGRIAIPITDKTASQKEHLRNGTAKERILVVKKLHAEGKTVEEIRGITNMSRSTIRKYLNLDEQQIPDGITVRARSHEKAILKVQQKADWVRKLHADGLSQNKIVQTTGFTAGIVKRYLSSTFTPVNGHYGKSGEGKLAPYRETVLKMRRDGMKYEQIAEHIGKSGYTGSVAALRGFVTKEKRLQADLLGDENSQEKELIERKWMVHLLYRPLEKVKGITKEQYEAVIKEYPKVELVYHAIETFKLGLATKETKHLLEWMEEVRALEIEELNSFIRGLEKDIEAVKNAVIFDCNNGLAEGSVNKLKVMKRIMYGRCSFELLRKKVILWDRWKHTN